MRAARVTRLDGPTAIEVADVPEPTPGPDDVLVEVYRVGISFPDLLLTKGEYQLKPELPFTLGVDFAGTAVEEARGFEGRAAVTAVDGTAPPPSGSPTRRRSRSPCRTPCRTTRARRCR